MAEPSSNETTRFAHPSLCPICGYEMTAASTADRSLFQPKEGDLAICINCGAMLAFGAKMRLHMATREQREEMKHEAPDQYALLVQGSASVIARGPIPGAVQRGPRA